MSSQSLQLYSIFFCHSPLPTIVDVDDHLLQSPQSLIQTNLNDEVVYLGSLTPKEATTHARLRWDLPILPSNSLLGLQGGVT